MRILEFSVNKQRLNKQRGCDFSGLVAGTIGYLHAKFYFTEDDWSECTAKIARFWINETEHAVVLDPDNCCIIPREVLIESKFDVSVLGVAPGYKIKTNKICVRQGVN